VAIGLSSEIERGRPAISEPDPSLVVALPGGEAVSPTFVYGPGFREEWPTPRIWPDGPSGTAPFVPDVASHGLWIAHVEWSVSYESLCPHAPCRRVRFVGETVGPEVLVPSDDAAAVLPILGGGLAVPSASAGGGFALVRPDGSHDDVPAPPPSVFDAGVMGVLADGTLCGRALVDPMVGDWRVTCIDREGTRRDGPSYAELPGAAADMCGVEGWCVGPDSFYSRFDGFRACELVRLDPEMLTATTVAIDAPELDPDRCRIALLQGPEGDLFARVANDDEFGRLFRLEGDTAAEVDLPGLAAVRETPRSLVVLRDFFVVLADDGERAVAIRLPRDP
jgi:hypothetical protein